MPRKVEAFDMMDEDESSYFEADFTRELATGETIASATVAFDPTGELAAAGSVTIVNDGTTVRAKLAGGVAGTKYFVKFTATTTSGQILPRTTSVTIGTANRPLT
jgi:hypothetical protein